MLPRRSKENHTNAFSFDHLLYFDDAGRAFAGALAAAYAFAFLHLGIKPAKDRHRLQRAYLDAAAAGNAERPVDARLAPFSLYCFHWTHPCQLMAPV